MFLSMTGTLSSEIMSYACAGKLCNKMRRLALK